MKYTTDQRLRWVKLYLEEHRYEYPEEATTRQRKHSFAAMVRFLAGRYMADGISGIVHGSSRSFTAWEKLDAIRPIIEGLVGYKVRSNELGIQGGTLCAWLKRYRESGLEGLECSKRGRTPMNKKKAGRKPKKPLTEEGKALEEAMVENHYLKAENEYLKKLKALVDARESRESGKRPSQSGASSKARKDSR
ncbi:MAG: helix-turn-helix domain-containing protein [Bacilli bacterium]|jgi:transposase|nr:helix-turn-helix domain-containing protein [Bacilli bacterium]MCH3966286.1 helix-turn-helix domain-containing protein [Bacilli bacterium]MCH3966332.1 helix-turn-helix domain-containing protein [Bacilli bacterium]MCH3966575.1 helix-turn-helix domain-containing protein [Bacilli bacterium]MCH3966871.1 helix-turn-helix domain-containing protein [Bacilli bacterium]